MRRVLRTSGLLLACALLIASSGLNAQQPTRSEPAFFPIGVWYSGGKARAPMLEKVDATSAQRWGRDLDSIKSTGFDMVKTWIDWSTAEPRKGEYHFENLDLLLKLAEERGLRVVVQLYMDSAPDWVGEEFPDGKFVDRSGAVIESQAAPGFCVDQPGVRGAMERFIRAVATDAGRSRALYGWDVWSEPHVINWAEFPYLVNPEFCFCPYSQARFREWLKQKYGTLDALNAAWYRHFERWEQVTPPRGSTILSYRDYLDWREFIRAKIAGDLKMRVDAVRGGDPAHAITSHAAVPSLFTSPTNGYGDPDDWDMAANADYFGTSIYPRHAATVSQKGWSWQQLSAALDFERSVGHSFNKGFWIGELQAGQGVTGMRIAEPVEDTDLRTWMWQTVAHGARQVAIYAWYPMSSGYESNGYGLINLDGTLTPRAKVAGETARIIQEHAAELLAAQPAPAEVAILYNPLAQMVGGAQPSLSKLGNAERDSLMGLHRAFTESQIPVDFVAARDVISGRISQYKTVFAPYPVMLSKDVAAGLKRYVENGGNVVAEARLAWNDERGQASEVIPGFGLDEVFGARERLITPVETAPFDFQIPGSPEIKGAAGEGFIEELEPYKAHPGGPSPHVIATFANGAPAMVSYCYGKNGSGCTVLVGTFIGLAYQRHPTEALRNVILQLAPQSKPPFRVETPNNDVEVRRLVGMKAEFIFVFNHAAHAASGNLHIRGNSATDVLELVSGSAAHLTSGEDAAQLPFNLPTNGVAVFRLAH